jgi:hypothetical protein
VITARFECSACGKSMGVYIRGISRTAFDKDRARDDLIKHS